MAGWVDCFDGGVYRRVVDSSVGVVGLGRTEIK